MSIASHPRPMSLGPESAGTQRRIFKRKLLDNLTIGAAYAGAATMLLLLLALTVVLVVGAWPAVTHFGWRFIFSSAWDPQKDAYGALPAILGTIASAFLSLLIAVPVSIGCAVFLVRIAPRWMRGILVQPCSFLIELLAAIPSITYGLWGVAVMVPLMQKHLMPFFAPAANWKWFQTGVIDNGWTVEPVYFPANLFASNGGSGYNLLTASAVLAIMVIPIVTAVTRDVLRVVPKDLEQGAYGLGATWWQSTKLVLSFAKSGIIGAVVLGLARAIGETMAVTMVIGNSTELNSSIFGPWCTMTTMLANKFRDVPRGIAADSLTYIALILLVMTVLINLAARSMVGRVAGKKGR